VTASAHPDARKIKSMSISLPKGTKLVRKRARRSAVSSDGAGFVVRPRSSRRLDVSATGRQGAGRVVVRLRRGAVRLTGKVRKAVRRGKTRRLRLKVVTVDTDGKKFVARATAKAKRR
jgi:hypothetical protein